MFAVPCPRTALDLPPSFRIFVRMKRKTVKKLIFIPLGSLVLLLGLVIGAAALLLTPKRLTPMVTDLCDRYLDAQVRFDTVSVALFRDFPYVTLQLHGAEVVSHAFDRLPDSVRVTLPAEADTLARIGRLAVSLNPWKLASGRADIRRIALEAAHLHAFVAPDSTANWEIYRADTTAREEADTTDGAAFEIDIERISVRKGLHLVYDSRPDSIAGTVYLRSFFVRGQLSTDLFRNEIRRLRLRECTAEMSLGGQSAGLRIDSLTADGGRREGLRIGLDARTIRFDDFDGLDSLQLRTALRFDGPDRRELNVSHFDLRLNDILVTAAGQAIFRGDSIVTAIGVQSPRLPIAGLLQLIPTSVMPLARDYETDLAAALDLRIDGPWNPATGALPDITADYRMPAGYLFYVKDRNGSRIDTLALDATLRFRPRHPDSTGVELREFKVSGIGMRLEAHGDLDRLTGDAGFNGAVKGDLSLDYLSRHFPAPDGSTFGGRIAMDLHGRARLSQLDLGRIGAARIGGHLTMDGLSVVMPNRQFRLTVDGGRFGMGTGLAASDSLIAAGTEAIGATLSLDTIDMDMGRDLCVKGQKIKIHATTATKNLVRDTTAVHPSQGTLAAAGLRIVLNDSTTVIGRRLDSQWSILPARDNPKIPQLAFRIEARRLSLRQPAGRFSVTRGSVALDATLNRPDTARLQRRAHRLDSLQRLYPGVPRDSLFAHARKLRGRKAQPADEFAESDIDMRVSSEIGNALRRWQLNGAIRARSGRIVTPYFPLPTTLRDIDIAFNTNEIRLNRTFVKAGESQAVLTGEISGLRRAMLGGGRIRGDLEVAADTLNLNEIIRVANAGSTLVAQGGVSETESDDQLEERILQSADTTAAGALLVIPSNIDMRFDLTIRRGMYANLQLDSLSGEVIARNRVLQLSDLTMRSNAGNLRMTGLYSTRTPKDIQAGFDLEMEQMQVARLIELIPSIDTLMPMLRSFSGVVDCQLAATARIDSAMNILLPTVDAACHISGDSLVLLDGETFTEISKMLMFKNKKRNLIDHISAEFLVRDSQIEIFPFVIEIDRYRAAVSGVHKMDMTFNYHISVLKSPIPFRLGVDIFGNLDDFDFKITRARYKDSNLPTRVAIIETTRVNLRNYIRDVFVRGARSTSDSSLRITPETAAPTEILPPADSLSAADSAALKTFEQKD